MTCEACSHFEIHRARSHRLFRQIPMATGAGNPSCIVGGVAKFDVRLAREAVHAHPRNLLFLHCILNDFFNFRLIDSQLCMTQHALAHRRNAGCGPDIRTRMAINTCETEFHVSVVGELNRLLLRTGGGRNTCNQAETV